MLPLLHWARNVTHCAVLVGLGMDSSVLGTKHMVCGETLQFCPWGEGNSKTTSTYYVTIGNSDTQSSCERKHVNNKH